MAANAFAEVMHDGLPSNGQKSSLGFSRAIGGFDSFLMGSTGRGSLWGGEASRIEEPHTVPDRHEDLRQHRCPDWLRRQAS
ncbi:MAG: hypothetical protein KDG55_00525 [Rhodocyclaceae bacterium]|nr:hypothetical protein [Rhodocyclaceae bacterium]